MTSCYVSCRRLADGRVLCFGEYGDPNGLPVFVFHGTPGSHLMFRLTHQDAVNLGLRLIALERPGFGNSSYQTGRTLADWPKDVEAIADILKIKSFGVAGISGGGPYAVACAALLPARVVAAAVISPIGPVIPPEGAAHIGTAHHIIFRRLHRVAPLGVLMASMGRLMFLYAPGVVYNMMMRRASPSDRAVLMKPGVRQNLLEGVREGFRPGIRGVMREMKIFGAPWGLPFSAIRCPTFLWQGLQDRNVPAAAAHRLATLIPNCQLTLIEEAGHYWIFEHIREVLQTMKTAMQLHDA